MADEPKPQAVTIPLTPSVHDEITALTEFWRTRALLRAVEVDSLKVELRKAASALAEAEAITGSSEHRDPEQ